MAIKDIYTQAINSLANEKAHAVDQIKQKVTAENIVPHNAEVDKKLNDAVRELTEKHNQNVQHLQATFNAEKQHLVDIATAEKKDYAEATINAECELVRIEYDSAISHIREKIQENEG